MFRKMRRARQQMPEEEALELLREGYAGVLALNGDDGYPYAVPLNYVYTDGKLYFHGAKSGYRFDAASRDGKVSFCVVGQSDNVPEKFTCVFRSVVVFGRASYVTDEEEKRSAIGLMLNKYAPERLAEDREKAIASEWSAMAILRVDVEHVTGKKAVELLR